MTKKTIVLFLIALLILNTLFWINVLTQKSSKLRKPLLESGEIKSREYTYSEKLEYALRDLKHSKGVIIFLLITDAVLIAISFMIILLYKERTIGDKK